MNCDVFDTYVTRPNGDLMHFDIIVPTGTAQEMALAFGHAYLATVGVNASKLIAEQCHFCHVEQATSEMQQAIEQKGYFILAMEGCPPVAVHSMEVHDE